MTNVLFPSVWLCLPAFCLSVQVDHREAVNLISAEIKTVSVCIMSLSKSCLLNQTHSLDMTISHWLIRLLPSFCSLSVPFDRSPTLQEEEKATPSASKKPGKVRQMPGREKSVDSSSTPSSTSAEKQRQEARKRLLAAKKAASFRQNSATESADNIEIYVPEAQTRLWERRQEGRIKGLISVTELPEWGGGGGEQFCNANEEQWRRWG